jgi:hypothetical protein
MPADKGKKLVAKWNKSRKQRLRQHSPPGRREEAVEMRTVKKVRRGAGEN